MSSSFCQCQLFFAASRAEIMILAGRAILERGGADLGDAYEFSVPRVLK